MTNGRLVAGLVRCLLLAAMLQVPAGAQGPGPLPPAAEQRRKRPGRLRCCEFLCNGAETGDA